MTENREVKSDVFSMLMEDKKNALEVFNTLNGSDYQDPELVEIKTLEKGISLTIRNDAAFIIDMNLNIYSLMFWIVVRFLKNIQSLLTK